MTSSSSVPEIQVHRPRDPRGRPSPQLPRPTADLLRRARDGERELTIEYAFEHDPGAEGALGQQLRAEAQPPPTFAKPLSRALGKLRVGAGDYEPDGLRVIYLPADRNPIDELARRDADILVELLRAEQQRQVGHRSLRHLRRRAEELLGELANDALVFSLEERVQGIMQQLAAGISKQVPFFGAQRIDDRFLARVLELLLAAGLNRSEGQRLELSGLGYVNLLHIAVTLAAIPDLSEPPASEPAAQEPAAESASAEVVEMPQSADWHTVAEPTPEEAQAELDEADEKSEADEDSFFAGVFHATVVIEEPEAHLHPQLQHGLIRHLRRVVERRSELQVIVSSHAPDLISAVEPRDVVVIRNTTKGRRTFALANLPGAPAIVSDTLRRAALHLDASRSASLFAERLLIVEGVTDALIVRKLGRHWADDDIVRANFIDALTIVPIGSKVGEWPIRLLATPGFELASRVGVLTDSDTRGEEPSPPAWVQAYGDGVVLFRQSHPTLEPSLALQANSAVLTAALADVGVAAPTPLTAEATDGLFRGARKDDETVTPAGPAADKKGEFAYALAARLDDAEIGQVEVPPHMAELFKFLIADLETDDEPDEIEPDDVPPEGVEPEASDGDDGQVAADDAPPAD